MHYDVMQYNSIYILYFVRIINHAESIVGDSFSLAFSDNFIILQQAKYTISSLVMRRTINLSYVRRWLVWGTQRSVWIRRRTRARCVECLPRKLWDRIILFVFTCCLITFLRAFFGIGLAPEGTYITSMRPTTSTSGPPIPPRSELSRKEDPRGRGGGEMQVIVDWHGDYELFPSARFIFLSASIPQDAFPDPTPARVSPPEVDVPFSVTTGIGAPTDVSVPHFGVPYDPFRLDFREEEEVDSADHGLYPVVEPPSTVERPIASTRMRRFTRRRLAEDCL
ncbi:hypothetical protein PAXRUDRAFT_828663 [Paxillus rubicundulus Ve08.2h10]|uniref:Transmembrane protein n=1 Tax=Paxillus rubicundulus Ve08.2h10 TaxID=930991 RepID=A0A0D0DP64_9AGAM|nr:hypothetical protein PAXRUDRAFT_828663 [Paxillus rubicundulus Ve08.2h10]